jgi:hypothetical protein
MRRFTRRIRTAAVAAVVAAVASGGVLLGLGVGHAGAITGPPPPYPPINHQFPPTAAPTPSANVSTSPAPAGLHPVGPGTTFGLSLGTQASLNAAMEQQAAEAHAAAAAPVGPDYPAAGYSPASPPA